MPLYIADYLGDTSHLSAAEHGGYLLLIMHYWRTGPLPPDDGTLRKIARMIPGEWEQSKDVLRSFFQERDGKVRHKRIDAEIGQASGRIEARSKGGKAGAQKRWHNSPNDTAMAHPMTNGCQNDGP